VVGLFDWSVILTGMSFLDHNWQPMTRY